MKILPNKKPYRVETELTQMTEELQTQFVIWMLTGVSCEKAHTELRDKFGLKKISIHQVKRYWQGESPAVLDWQRLRKKRVSPVGWEMNRRSALKKLEDPNLPFAARIIIIKFLETGRLQKTADPAATPKRPPQPGTEGGEPEAGIEDPDSLEDADIGDIRRLLFGDRLDEKLTTETAPASIEPTPPAPPETLSSPNEASGAQTDNATTTK